MTHAENNKMANRNTTVPMHWNAGLFFFFFFELLIREAKIKTAIKYH